MPAPANPRRRDYFVYQFKADGYPFYVGIGHAERASDRLRYVRSLMVPKNVDKLAEKALSVRVIAALLKRKVEIKFSCTRRPMNRRQALDLERRTIDRLVAAGFLLTNWQHNPYRHDDTARAVRAILRGRRTAGARSRR
jgi:hypothetical protein